jgi:DNA excision repair protein ERCC-2
MTSRDKDAFVAAFEQGGGGVRGFAVLGGSFSESIDLAGDRLVGVVIFGVGLPQVNIFNNTCRDFFEAKLGNGYAWAYLYPGLNRVLQAAGRVIRSEEDRGFVCLIDERYGTSEYRRLLPEHWQIRSIRETGDFARGLPRGLGG